MPEKATPSITIRDIDELLHAYRWLRHPPEPLLPRRDPELWRLVNRDKQTAIERYRKQPIRGDTFRTKEFPESQVPAEEVSQDELYRRLDPHYCTTYRAACRELARLLEAKRKEIDLLWVCMRPAIQSFSEIEGRFLDSGKVDNTYRSAARCSHCSTLEEAISDLKSRDGTPEERRRSDAFKKGRESRLDTVIHDLERIKAKLQWQQRGQRQSAYAATKPNKKAAELSPKTLGELLDRIEGSEEAYRRNSAVAERYERKGDPRALWWRIQAGVLRFQPDPKEWPGVDVLEAICQAEFASGLTAENLRRIRGRFVTERGFTPAAVDSMPIQQVCSELQGGKQSAGGEKRKLFWPIVLRTALWLLVLAALECAAGYCAWRWGEGQNLWQKITQSWQWFVAVFAACAIAYPFLLGRERWRLLQFWKGDEK